MLVALLVMYVPAVQLGLVQTAQKLALARAENSPAAQGAQVRSLVAVPFAETKLPALQMDHAEQELSLVALPFAARKFPVLQFDHFEQAPWLEPVEKVCGPHEEHARSEVEDPAALTKVPPPQTVQGVHLAVGGRLDSDALPK